MEFMGAFEKKQWRFSFKYFIVLYESIEITLHKTNIDVSSL